MSPTASRNLVLVGPMYPFRGGIAHFFEKMYWGLNERGHRTSAVTFTRQYPDFLFPGKTQYETGSTENPVPADRMLDSMGPASWYRTARAIADRRPDAVIFKYWMPFFAPCFGTVSRRLRKRGIKTLVVIDNALPHERRPGDLTLSRYFLKSCSGAVVMSTTVEDDLARLDVKIPTRRAEHPVYDNFGPPAPRAASRAALGLPPDAPVLLFFGFIRRYKGLSTLIESMPRILDALPEARLVVAGEFYEDESAYRARIQALGLEDRLILRNDYIPTEAVATYFSAADVIVQPYLSATQSGVAQVAYHFERPLVVTAVGGLAEFVPHEKAGLVVPPADPEALADAVVRFFREDLGPRLSDGVREEKKKYSWDRMFEALEELL